MVAINLKVWTDLPKFSNELDTTYGMLSDRRGAAELFLRRSYATDHAYIATLCSLSTLFLTVGRFIMRSCQAV